MRPTAVLPALALVVGLGLVAGCGADENAATSSGAGNSAMSDADAAAAAAPGGTTESLVQARPAAGAIVRTGTLSLQVADVPQAADESGRLARAVGGRVDSDERTAGNDGEDGRAVLVLRLPPPAFEPTLERLTTLGTERGRQLGSQDVTDQVVDLQSRLATQRASVARLQALLARATEVGEIVAVEGELTKRTAELESLEARLAAVEDTVALATLTVNLDADRARTVGDALGFGDGLRAGVAILAGLGRGSAILVGVLVPFLPLLLVAAAVAVWLVRRRRRHATGTAPPAAGPPAPRPPAGSTPPAAPAG